MDISQHTTYNFQLFVHEHANDDPEELLLHASRYPKVDVKEAVIHIKAKRRIKDKAPAWYQDDRLIFPSELSAEQCSSELTAKYKQRFVQPNDLLCDLTGGMGVDAYYFSQKVGHVTYIDRDEACCRAAQSNFQTLGAANIETITGDAVELLAKNLLRDITVFYIDPSRRDTGNKRVYAINDCEPDLMKIFALLPAPYRIIIKLSPMLDIKETLSMIPSVQEVHVVSIKNDCKEFLVISDSVQTKRGLHEDVFSDYRSAGFESKQCNPAVYCVNYVSKEVVQSFHFRLQDEQVAEVSYVSYAGRYLYEPNASLLKAGAYKSVAMQYSVKKLHPSSHLYTSDQPAMTFPGRIFKVTDVIPFNNRICKSLSSVIPQANITVRNFPLSVDAFRKRTHICEGGDIYLFATTLSDNQKALLICHKLP